MIAFVVQRLFQAVLVMLTVALIAFSLFNFVGDPINNMVGQDTSIADRERLRCYYAEEQTLAAIGRKLGEHESSVSRNLERVRRTLREKVEALLGAGFSVANGSVAHPGLSDAEIAQCFSYAAEEAPIDLDALLPSETEKARPAGRKRESKPGSRPGSK